MVLLHVYSYNTSSGALLIFFYIAAKCFKYLTESFFWGTLSQSKVLPYGIYSHLPNVLSKVIYT